MTLFVTFKMVYFRIFWLYFLPIVVSQRYDMTKICQILSFYSLITLQSVDTSHNSRLYYSFGKYAHVGRVGGNIRYLHVHKICNVFVISTLIWRSNNFSESSHVYSLFIFKMINCHAHSSFKQFKSVDSCYRQSLI